MSTQKLRVKSLSGQAKEAILQYIEEMDLKTDNKLPREEALAEMLGVSRITIRQALNDLAAEGIIFRRQGRVHLSMWILSISRSRSVPVWN